MTHDHRPSTIYRIIAFQFRLAQLRLGLLQLAALSFVLRFLPGSRLLAALQLRLISVWLIFTRMWIPRGRATRTEDGQSTVEYALVLLGAAAVALALVAWVTRSDAIGRLFDVILGRVLSQAG